MLLEKTNAKGMVARYTTPTLRFKLSRYAAENIVNAWLIIKNCGKVILRKEFDSAEVNAATNTIAWKLSQEESGALPLEKTVSVYCRWLLNDGTSGRSKYAEAIIVDGGVDEVITDE